MQRGPEREVPARPKESVSLAVANGGIDPVPGGGRVDEIERFRLAFPRLEGRDVDLGGQAREVLARAGRELRSQLDADNAKAAREQRPRRLAGRAADLEQARARLELRERDQVVEELLRIIRPRGVVLFGRRVEGSA